MTSDYQFWLSANGEKEKIQLPVNPEQISIEHDSNNEKVHITGLGEITIMQSRTAVQISFSSFFPASYFPGSKTRTIHPPLTLINRINTWRESKKPIHFIVTSCGINLYCTIESFHYSEKGGDVGTYEYSLTLKEYREVTIRQISVNTATQKASVKDTNQRVDNTQKPQTYTVVLHDCLWNIAKKFYGDGSKYTIIRDANKEVIAKHGSNPNMIWPGDVLSIPA